MHRFTYTECKQNKSEENHCLLTPDVVISFVVSDNFSNGFGTSEPHN